MPDVERVIHRATGPPIGTTPGSRACSRFAPMLRS